jgi:hypothetical protein
MTNKQLFINYVEVNGKDKSWKEFAEQFDLGSADAARAIYRRYNSSANNLVLRSKWQAQTKNGVEWLESYRNVPTAQDILTVTSKIIPLHFPTYSKPKTLNNVGLYYLSDEHIGAEVSGGLYENNYNSQIFEDRITKIYNKIVDHAVFHGGFQDLYLVNLGDAIDGFNSLTTRGGHTLPQNMNNKEVFNTYLRVHSSLLQSILDAGIAQNIHYVAVSDTNHGGDIEYMCHKSLEYLFSASPVKFNIIEKFIDHVIIGDKCFCFTHGKDATDRKRGLPLNLTPDIETYIKQYIDINNLNGYEISFVKGDLHQSASYYSKFFRYRNTSSIFGSSKWLMINYGYTQPACDYDLIIEGELLEGRINLDKALKSNGKVKV